MGRASAFAFILTQGSYLSDDDKRVTLKRGTCVSFGSRATPVSTGATVAEKYAVFSLIQSPHQQFVGVQSILSGTVSTPEDHYIVEQNLTHETKADDSVSLISGTGVRQTMKLIELMDITSLDLNELVKRSARMVLRLELNTWTIVH